MSYRPDALRNLCQTERTTYPAPRARSGQWTSMTWRALVHGATMEVAVAQLFRPNAHSEDHVGEISGASCVLRKTCCTLEQCTEGEMLWGRVRVAWWFWRAQLVSIGGGSGTLRRLRFQMSRILIVSCGSSLGWMDLSLFVETWDPWIHAPMAEISVRVFDETCGFGHWSTNMQHNVRAGRRISGVRKALQGSRFDVKKSLQHVRFKYPDWNATRVYQMPEVHFQIWTSHLREMVIMGYSIICILHNSFGERIAASLCQAFPCVPHAHFCVRTASNNMACSRSSSRILCL